MRGNVPVSAMEPVDASGITALTPYAGHDLAVGLEYIRRKDLASARRVLDSVRSRIAIMKGAKSSDSAANRYTSVTQNDVDTVSVMEMILDAAIDFASGNGDNGIRKAVAAAETEDKLVFEYGPPIIVKPAWEVAAEMMLHAGRKTDAADAFRHVLKRFPNRRLANDGLRAATK